MNQLFLNTRKGEVMRGQEREEITKEEKGQKGGDMLKQRENGEKEKVIKVKGKTEYWIKITRRDKG